MSGTVCQSATSSSARARGGSVVHPREGDGKQGRDHAQAGVNHARRRQRETDEYCRDRKSEVAKDNRVGDAVAQRNEHDQDIGEDQERVEDLEEGVLLRRWTIQAHTTSPAIKTRLAKRTRAISFLAPTKLDCVVRVARDRLVALHPEVDDEQGEDDQRTGGIGEDVEDPAGHLS